MPIKYAILRTDDGQAYDLLRPGCKTKAGVGGRVEALATDGGTIRVGINGVELTGNPPRFPDDLTTDTADVILEQVKDDAVLDTKEAKVQITGLPEQPPADPKPPVDPPTPPTDETKPSAEIAETH